MMAGQQATSKAPAPKANTSALPALARLSSATTLWGRNKIVLLSWCSVQQRYDARRDLTSSHFTIDESQTITLHYFNPTLHCIR
jgi:hypothetical protein